VYVVGADDKVQVRPVKAHDVVDGVQWIRSGLQAGETVVTVGQSRVANGVLIHPVAPQASGSADAVEAQR
jgi:multidrug efflux system membrane fusion protein